MIAMLYHLHRTVAAMVLYCNKTQSSWIVYMHSVLRMFVVFDTFGSALNFYQIRFCFSCFDLIAYFITYSMSLFLSIYYSVYMLFIINCRGCGCLVAKMSDYLLEGCES